MKIILEDTNNLKEAFYSKSFEGDLTFQPAGEPSSGSGNLQGSVKATKPPRGI